MKKLIILNSQTKRELMTLYVNVLNAKPKRLIKKDTIMITTDDITGLVTETKKVFDKQFVCTTIRLKSYMQGEFELASYIYFITKNNRNWKEQKRILEMIIDQNGGVE